MKREVCIWLLFSRTMMLLLYFTLLQCSHVLRVEADLCIAGNKLHIIR